MDVVYHAVVGAAIAKGMGYPQLEVPAAICAMLPDLIGTAPFFYYKLTHIKHTSSKQFARNALKTTSSNTFYGTTDRKIYHATHSFITATFVGIITYLFLRDAWLVLTLAYASHIIIDIPTHDGDFATQFFYPFSHVHITGKNWAKHPVEFLIFWGILLAFVFRFNLI